MADQLRPINLDPVLQWIKENSVDGIAPLQNIYEQISSASGMPSRRALAKQGWTWSKLAEAAGVGVRQRGRPSQASIRWHMSDLLACLCELAEDGMIPTCDTYERRRKTWLPSVSALMRQGYLWHELAAKAGLKARPSRAISEDRKLDRLESEVQKMFAEAEPPVQDSWPINGIPTRTVVHDSIRPDGSVLRTTRQYCSLR